MYVLIPYIFCSKKGNTRRHAVISVDELTAELNAHAPIFYKLFRCCLISKGNPVHHNRQPVYSEDAIGMSAAILRYCNKE